MTLDLFARATTSDIRRTAQAGGSILIALLVAAPWLDGCGGRVFSRTDDAFDGSGSGAAGGSIHEDSGTSPQPDASIDSQVVDATTGGDDAVEFFSGESTTAQTQRRGQG